LEIRLNDGNWFRVFDSPVNFQEHILQSYITRKNKHTEIYKQICNPTLKELEELERYKNKIIQGILIGSVCEFDSFDPIKLSNDRCKLNINLRDLHRFEGEVQISGFSYELM